MWWVEEREVGHVVIVDNGPGESHLVAGEAQLRLEAGECAVGLVDDQVRAHLRNKPKFTLADLAWVVEELHVWEMWSACAWI